MRDTMKAVATTRLLYICRRTRIKCTGWGRRKGCTRLGNVALHVFRIKLIVRHPDPERQDKELKGTFQSSGSRT